MRRETIVLLGVNHKTTPLAIREQLALSTGYDQPLADLRALYSVKEHYLLSTCNRIEVLFTATDPDTAITHVLDLLFAGAVSREELGKHVYCYRDGAAVEHLFLVASSLDSMIVGESQILGQLKKAYRFASGAGATGYILNKLLHRSFSVAKRVRTETGIGASAVSISSAAVELSRKIFGDLTGKKVLLIGAGEMAELAAEHLVGQGVSEVVVANRTLERAVKLARRFNGKAVALAEVKEQLALVDIIISSTGAAGLLLHKSDVQAVMRQRRNRRLFFIDIAVPRDLDPAINTLSNAYLYDIDDLSQVVEMNRSERDREAVKAHRIIDEEKLKFHHWLDIMELTPTIVELRAMADQVVQNELERTMGRLSGMDDKQRRSVEKMAAAIAGKLLHHPLKYLKQDNRCVSKNDRIKMVRTVFGIDNGSDSGK
ncbi:MAG: glutamyl-tRNA reductase [Desulfobulbus propionicus]|nr:MAG: glutamyl-tRNA reductase [Desulfobulbus propionicus]